MRTLPGRARVSEGDHDADGGTAARRSGGLMPDHFPPSRSTGRDLRTDNSVFPAV